jgi:polysaccharide biosynthesis/export protein
MSQDSRFGRLLALLALFAGVGCSPLPVGSDSNSKANAMMGERLSSSQNAPLPAKASAFASTQNAPLPATAPGFESTMAPSQTVAPSQMGAPSQKVARVASATTDVPVIESPPPTRLAASRDSAGATTRFAASRDSADLSDDGTDYTITSQDVLQVAIFQVPDLNRTVRVDGGGFVSLPLIGQVPVRGKSILQAQEDIAARYSKSYLQSPQVTLSLVRSGQRVTVNGAVKNPTVLSLDGTLTLSMAIAQSGGLSELGNSARVHVARPTAQQVEDSIYNLDDIQAGKAQNPVLRGGDIVVVEESNTKLALKNMKDILPFAAVGAFLSDARLKRDITPIAKRENGLQLYRYRYVWSDTLYVGVLAQEVLEVAPNAVSRGADGYLRVDYARLGLRMWLWEDWLASHPNVLGGLVPPTKGRHDGDSLRFGRT